MNKNNLFRMLIFSISYYPFYILVSNTKTIVKIGAIFGILIILIIGYLPFKNERK